MNGWHNVVHLVSGIVLALLASNRSSARLGALVFGLIYALATVIGLIDGNDVLGILPVKAADNLLHVAPSALGLVAGIASGGPDRGPSERSAPAYDDDDGADTGRTRRPARRPRRPRGRPSGG